MAHTFTEEEVAEALATCANEPVQMPGTVQRFGCLLIADAETWTLEYASENTAEIIDLSARDLIGLTLSEICGEDVAHAIRGRSKNSINDRTGSLLGHFEINSKWCATNAFQSGSHVILELEEADPITAPGVSTMSTVAMLIREIESCKKEQDLHERTVDLLRHVTGYDRVTIYRFDAEWNGEIIAEAKRKSVDTLLGLHFPQWDIPAQARAIMMELPLRLIEDVNQSPVPILAARPGMPNIDITPAATRGVSMVHMQYLRNMGVAATMTLPIKIEGALWGIISFHHMRPRVPSALTREVLRFFMPIFETRLNKLFQDILMARIRNLDSILLSHENAPNDDNDAFETMVPFAMEAFDGSGIAVRSNDTIEVFGKTPTEPLLNRIFDDMVSRDQDVIAIDSLPDLYPDETEALNGIAGVLATPFSTRRMFLIFRPEQAQKVTWAGSPNKDIQRVDDKPVLSPRASFAKFLDDVSGRSVAWSRDDLSFARHVRMFLNAAERQALAVTLARHQEMMIEELNHRIRNIIALVRSVSAQARRRYGTLNSYAAAMEQRIRALASTLEIERGKKVAAVRLRDMISQELVPHSNEDRFAIEGPDLFVRATEAPVVALVMHELVTNAVKHGALSNNTGTVKLTIEKVDDAYSLDWCESGGPPVQEPKRYGFGTALIEQAIPHELGGKAEYVLDGDGLKAVFFIPIKHFTNEEEADILPVAPLPTASNDAVRNYSRFKFPSGKSTLVLEDNFIIAKEMRDLLEDLGCDSVEMCSNTADALDLIEDKLPDFAVLDINLSDAESSEQVAMALVNAGCPFIFVSGYRNKRRVSESLKDVPLLAKPVNEDEFITVISDLLT